MRVSLDYTKHIIIMGLLVLFLGACVFSASPLETPTNGSNENTIKATPALTQTVDAPTPTPTPTTTPTVQPLPPAGTPTPLPTMEWLAPISPIAVTPVAPSTATLHTLRLEKQSPGYLTLDEKYLYWTVHGDAGHIFRYPLAGGVVETVASTNFADGELSVLRPIRSGDWLIFMDTPASAEATIWTIRALNLKDGTEQVLLDEPGDPSSWPGPCMDADGDWVVWTRNKQAEEKDCVETIMGMRNLRTGEWNELERSCAEDQHMWMFPHLSGEHLVVEQDLPDSKGRGNNIYLYDLTTRQRVALTDDGRSSMPDISDRWVVWKAGPRFSYGRATIIYDLQSGQRFKIKHDERLAGHLAGHWLYWRARAKQPLYVYNIETEQMLRVVVPGVNEGIDGVAIYGNTIAWARDLDFAHSAPHDSLLEWRTLP